MSDENERCSENGGRSPFWAILIVFCAMIVGYGVQLNGLINQRQQLRKTEASLAAVVPQAKVINTKLHKVTQDLMELSLNSPAAKQIVRDFNIQVK